MSPLPASLPQISASPCSPTWDTQLCYGLVPHALPPPNMCASLPRLCAPLDHTQQIPHSPALAKDLLCAEHWGVLGNKTD